MSMALGRYRWRHDQVLRELADIIEKERKKRGQKRDSKYIKFVKEGDPTKVKKPSEQKSILDSATLWEMQVDLVRRLVRPDVVNNNLRPDIVLWSHEGKEIIMVELTVPWEERCEVAYQRKKIKYQDLADDICSKGWSAWVFPVEIGCGGFPAQSTWRAMTVLGIKGKERKAGIQRLSTTAEKSSFWLWWGRALQS
ncbi:uncharacterized protein [Magallana gigas]|uniref:uncharacterized protein n=1 Tax=Magallana gigas TaxID=29159 RepID=UPI00334245BF